MNRTPGAGGRNQQFAMACALELEQYQGERLTVLSAGSDGIDGNTRSAGPSRPHHRDPRARFRVHLNRRWRPSTACPMFTALATPW